MNKFEFITSYGYYGRRKINEDELDDALGLNTDTSSDQTAAPTQSPAPSETGSQPPTGLDQTNNPPAPPDGSDPIDNSMSDSAPTSSGSEVQLDVTQLVLKQQEISQSVQDMMNKIDQVIKSTSGIEANIDNKMASMKKDTDESNEKLRQEFEKRNPTNIEKLQLRSLSSFPYNIKLSDYWTPTTEDKYKYAVANSKISPEDTFTVKTENQPEAEEKEYVLMQSDIDKGYDENKIKKSI